MTIGEETSTLLRKVLERTQEGKLSWETVAIGSHVLGSYELSIANLKVVVNDPEGPAGGDPEFIVYDSDGVELDSITTMTDRGLWNVELLTLARLARLSARKATGKYAAALEALDRTG